MRIWIKGGRLIDPGNLDETGDIRVEDGDITEVRPAGKENGDRAPATAGADHVIDATGMIVAPGLIDMHVHLREPGHEYKETIQSGCTAAAAGGFSAVCAMPNTDPVNDHPQITEFILEQARKARGARVFPVGSISCGLHGKNLAGFGDLKAAGAIAVSDDGCPVMNAQLMRRALEYAAYFDLLVISHCEDSDLAGRGVMNEGGLATRMGLAGIPNASESVMVMRDIALAELTGTPIHIAHVSTRQSVHAIRDAKKRGLPVTAETAPHYFTLTEADVKEYDTHAKMNPPLRAVEDRQAVMEGLADGTIDAIATDHAPHSSIEKNVEFDQAANGIIGLETSLALSLNLVRNGYLDESALIERMCTNPARILGLERGLRPGYRANITVIDPNFEYQVDADRFFSISRNTPFDGWRLKGRAAATLVDGRIVFSV